MLISIALFNQDTVNSGEAKIIKSNISSSEFNRIAKKSKFGIKKSDTSLLGYYFVNNKGDAMVSYPAYHKVNSLVTA